MSEGRKDTLVCLTVGSYVDKDPYAREARRPGVNMGGRPKKKVVQLDPPKEPRR